MRLGLLGPADGNVDGLARAAEVLVEQVKVDRAIYLGADGALDQAVAAWAARVVGSDPSDDAAWKRAAEVAVRGTPTEIDAFVARERARQRLRVLEGLPAGGGARTVEMVGDRVAVLLYDKGGLDEEDIFAASLLVYGKSSEPLVKKIGARWFVTPGSINSPGGGAAVLDDDGEEIVASVYAADGSCTLREPIAIARATKMKIQGGSG
jgi:hypothetical protein